MAFSVLREHEGSQWDAQVIDHVMAVLPAMTIATATCRTSVEPIGRVPMSTSIRSRLPTSVIY